MGNIVGEGFPRQIINQVRVRQEKKGSLGDVPSPEVLTWLNANTGWVRVVSSVDLVEPKNFYNVENTQNEGQTFISATNSGLGNIAYNNNLLAREYMLMGGAIAKYYPDSDPIIREGVEYSGANNNLRAYGLGGLDLGIRPMPGITSFSIKSETRGSLRTATIQIKAFNRYQFEVISALYMSLGYTVLLEWGNTMYYNNNGEFQSENPYTLSEEFLSGKIDKQQATYDRLLFKMNSYRLQSNGNYDAALGKVVNFSWTLAKDLSYDITVTVRTIGDIIESLKTNVLTGDIKTTQSTATSAAANAKASETVLQNEITRLTKEIADKNAKLQKATVAKIGSVNDYTNYTTFTSPAIQQDAINILNSQLKTLQSNLDKSKESLTTLQNKQANPDPALTFAQVAQQTDIGRIINSYISQISSVPSSVNGVSVLANGNDVYFIKQIYVGKDNATSPQYYVRLGKFLELVQDNLIPIVNDDPNQKLIKIDTDIDTNLIALYTNQLSSDPSICVFKANIQGFTKNNNNQVIARFLPEGNDFNPTPSVASTNNYGKLMNVYFNVFFLINNLDSLKDRNGGVSLIEYLKSISTNFCNATGNFNKIEPVIDEESNTIKFVDEVPLPERDVILKDFINKSNPDNSRTVDDIEFQVFGIKTFISPNSNQQLPKQSGIVRDIALTTTITPQLASMITIGAQSNGYIVGQDSTALSKLYGNFKDRIKNTLSNPKSVNTGGTETNKLTTNLSLEEKYKDVVDAYSLFISKLSNGANGKIQATWDKEAIDKFKNVTNTFAEFIQYKSTQKRQLEAQASGRPIPVSPTIGFIPFNLTLTIDGLSGMKVYQKYKINDDFLPLNYPDSVEFIIKNITHEIKDNQWITVLESIAVPKHPSPVDYNSATQEAVVPNTTTPNTFSPSRGGATRTIEGVVYRNGNVPATKLRTISNAAKYKGAIDSDNGNIRLYDKASIALDKLIAAADAAGIPVKINSAYRTVPDQVRVWSQNCLNAVGSGKCQSRANQGSAAVPGTSNHGFGLAVDFANSSLKRIKPGDALYEWLVAGNGAKFGFKRIQSESWHWEYQI